MLSYKEEGLGIGDEAAYLHFMQVLPGRFLKFECAGSNPPFSNTYCGCLNVGVLVVLQRFILLGDVASGDSATVCIVVGTQAEI
jgi:hypothetical protein